MNVVGLVFADIFCIAFLWPRIFFFLEGSPPTIKLKFGNQKVEHNKINMVRKEIAEI